MGTSSCLTGVTTGVEFQHAMLPIDIRGGDRSIRLGGGRVPGKGADGRQLREVARSRSSQELGTLLPKDSLADELLGRRHRGASKGQADPAVDDEWAPAL